MKIEKNKIEARNWFALTSIKKKKKNYRDSAHPKKSPESAIPLSHPKIMEKKKSTTELIITQFL